MDDILEEAIDHHNKCPHRACLDNEQAILRFKLFDDLIALYNQVRSHSNEHVKSLSDDNIHKLFQLPKAKGFLASEKIGTLQKLIKGANSIDI